MQLARRLHGTLGAGLEWRQWRRQGVNYSLKARKSSGYAVIPGRETNYDVRLRI
jgi:hypothetical protein